MDLTHLGDCSFSDCNFRNRRFSSIKVKTTTLLIKERAFQKTTNAWSMASQKKMRTIKNCKLYDADKITRHQMEQCSEVLFANSTVSGIMKTVFRMPRHSQANKTTETRSNGQKISRFTTHTTNRTMQ